MPLTSYALDTFVAPKLSRLTQCNAPGLTHLQDSWLTNFVLNPMLRARIPEEQRKEIFNLLRRSEGAFYAYQNARIALSEYVGADRDRVSLYFHALLHFEVFLAQYYQACNYLIRLIGEKKLFRQGDGTPVERINRLYNESKYTRNLWITNEGIECDAVQITFTEIRDLLEDLAKVAKRLSDPMPSQ